MSSKSSKSSYLAEKRKQAIQDKVNKQKRKQLCLKSGIIAASVIAVVLAAVICVQVVLNSGVLLSKKIIKGDSFTVNAGMISYYMYERLESIVDYYGESLSSMNFNPESSLKKQDYSSTQTFFEYLADDAYSTASSLLYSCEAAKKEGFDITEQRKQALRERVSEMDADKYGRGIKNEDIYNALYMTVLAAEYNAETFNESAPAIKDIENYFDKNEVYCQRIDYLKYTIDYAKDDEADEENAKSLADKMALCKTDTDFSEEALKHYTDGKETSVSSSSTSVKKLLDMITFDNQSYSESTLNDWLFKESNQYDTKVLHNSTGNCYEVIMLVSEPYLDTQKTVNVRHILISLDDFNSTEDARAEAERIYGLYTDGNKTEESFAVLATRYSSDPGSYTLGGLYERTEKGSMVAEFDAWCFDENRKAGDTDIVASSYGYHIMYFCGDSLLNWQLDYYNETAENAQSEKLSELTAEIEIKEYKDRIYSIPER